MLGFGEFFRDGYGLVLLIRWLSVYGVKWYILDVRC